MYARVTVNCVRCGVEFSARASTNPQYCSRACGAAVFRQRWRHRDTYESVIPGVPAHAEIGRIQRWRVYCVMCSRDWWLRGPQGAMRGISAVSPCPTCGGLRCIEESGTPARVPVPGFAA